MVAIGDRVRVEPAKARGFLTLGVGVMLLPKRMKCLRCGTWSKSGNAKPTAAPPQVSGQLGTGTIVTPAMGQGSVPGSINAPCQRCLALTDLAGLSVSADQFQCRSCNAMNHVAKCPSTGALMILDDSPSWRCPSCGGIHHQ
jgi:hypothetical protein